jgi:8-oxo-dGTP diphosphatase
MANTSGQPGQRDKVEAAGVIFVNGAGELLLHLRDSRPGIVYPDFWDVVGGKLEPGESREEALVREVMEEIGVELRDYVFYGTFETEGVRVHFHCARLDARADSLECNEGQGVRFFAPAELASLQVVPLTREALERFLSSKTYRSLGGGEDGQVGT